MIRWLHIQPVTGRPVRCNRCGTRPDLVQTCARCGDDLCSDCYRPWTALVCSRCRGIAA